MKSISNSLIISDEEVKINKKHYILPLIYFILMIFFPVLSMNKAYSELPKNTDTVEYINKKHKEDSSKSKIASVIKGYKSKESLSILGNLNKESNYFDEPVCSNYRISYFPYNCRSEVQ